MIDPEYAYDAVGNITQIKKNGSVYETYTYDNLNQLKTVTRGSDTYTYNYDSGGNILSVLLNGTAIKNYTYGDIQWFDLLTEYNGQTITYDQIGNPLQYRDGFNFAWSNGRQLTGVTKGTDNISYLYNADGLRASKTVNNITTDYYWLEGVLLGQKTGNDYIIYLYDENGVAYGIICNNTYYYYVFNAQGDVVGIIDQSGTQVVSYDYSVWGEVLNISGTMADTLGQQNPIRYRGYYYDTETGLYYASSRYYDPVTHRFINADGVMSGTSDSVNGYNLFSYCFNDPVNMTDSTGSWPIWNTIKSALNKATKWVKNNIVKPVKKFVKDIKTDIKNYDKNNTSEQKVLEANYFSSYKGAPVIKPPIGRDAFSYGVMVIGDDVEDPNTIKHEYGHYVQFQEIGIVRYTCFVAIPSLEGYWSDVDEYYSQPWEYGADLLGGVDPNVRTYTLDAEENYRIYWDHVTK